MEINQQNDLVIEVRNLERIGINHLQVVELYQENKGIKLNLNDLVKVSAKNEGQSISFETWDQISIVIPVNMAAGNYNKIAKY